VLLLVFGIGFSVITAFRYLGGRTSDREIVSAHALYWYFLGALFFAESLGTLFRLFPMPVLGVILFFGGVELAVSLDGQQFSRADRTVLAVTAGIALWNMGAAYVVGLLLYHANRSRVIRLE